MYILLHINILYIYITFTIYIQSRTTRANFLYGIEHYIAKCKQTLYSYF